MSHYNIPSFTYSTLFNKKYLLIHFANEYQHKPACAVLKLILTFDHDNLINCLLLSFDINVVFIYKFLVCWSFNSAYYACDDQNSINLCKGTARRAVFWTGH